MVPETWSTTDRIFCHFGLFFALLPPNSPKNQNLKKWKKLLEKSSFYTSVPKIMIIYHTVPEIWHVTDDVIVFSFWAIFCPFTPEKLNSTKNQN